MKSALLLLAAIGLILAGCGAGSLSTHAGAADALRTLNDEAVSLIDVTCRERARAAATNPDVTTDRAELDAASVLDACARIEAAQALAASAHDAWVAYLLQSLRDTAFDLQTSLAIAANFTVLYLDAADLGGQFDLRLPPLPGIFTALFGGDR